MIGRLRIGLFWVAAAAGFGLLGLHAVAGDSVDTSAERTDANHLFNVRRTGFTPLEFRPPYRLAWTYRSAHKPRPAWREPAWEVQRIDTDYAWPIASDGEMVYVASSSDHAVHALDLESGRPRWRFFTEGPLRLAPTVHGGKVYFSSDDGAAYCLEGATGRLLWKYRPDVPDQRLIGNEQMIHRWPARSGVLVHGDRAYTTFGMWSPEGIAIACLDAQTGKVLWQNDSSGTRYMTQPHYEAMGGVSPQGYLALCGDVLVVPCGRAAPAFFDAATGEFLYDEAEGLFPGGAWTMTFGELAFTPCEYLKKPNPVAPEASEAEICEEACLVALKARTGEEVFHLHGALRGVIDDEGELSLIGRKRLVSACLQDVLEAAPGGYEPRRGSSEGHFVEVDEHRRWETPVERVYELIQAGSTLIAGGRETLACYGAADGRPLWETKLAGDVRELLIAGRSLLASTTEGEVHCFRVEGHGETRIVREPKREMTPDARARERVAAVLTAGEVTDGYGLVLGDVDADDLVALARQSKLVWHWAAGSQDVHAVRAELADAGLYGRRVAIHNVAGDPLPYADYSANLLVFVVEKADDLERAPAAEIYRVLRPCGGAALVVCSDALRPAVDKWLAAGALPAHTKQDVAVGVRIQRGPLPGAGAWTHQYADAGKSGSSDNERVRLPLKVLWFGSVGPADIVSRHYRTPAPLATAGRMFVAGIDYLHAVDAYNGRILWERHLPGVGRWPAAYRGGSMAADEDAVYVPREKACLRLDPQTGQTLFTYKPPAADRIDESTGDDELIWEYLAVTDQAVVGTWGRPNIRRSWWSMAHPANPLLFVLDKATGRTLWTYEAQSAVDSNAIAIDEGRLFLIDGLAPADVFRRPVRRGEKPAPKRRKPVFRLPGAPHARTLKAFELSSGSLAWQTTEIGPRQNSLCVDDGVVVATTPIWHGLRAEQEGPGVSAFSAKDGQTLWTRQRPAPPPVIVGGVVYLPQACDLHTGEPVLREDPLTGQTTPFAASVTGGCGQLSGCPNVLMKRSGSMGFFDLIGRSGVYHFPNMRASCWVNMIPACGLVLVPEGSSSCPCAYNYKTSVAMMPAHRHNQWGLYTHSPRPKNLPIRNLRLNFGAPGDKQDGEDPGDVWFAFPRPSTTGPRGAGGMGRVPYDLLSMVTAHAEPAVTPILRNPDWTTIEDADHPWIYTCGLAGPLKLQVQLAPGGSPRGRYRVTLHFCELREPSVGRRNAPPDRQAGEATFDVMLQGETVLANLKVSEQAGGRNRPLVKQFPVEVAERLTLELVPRTGVSPIISAMRIEKLPGQ
jgi:outer membrane protein assembly factor BamB